MISHNLFGTDGIRGKVFQWPLLPSQITFLGSAIGFTLKNQSKTMIIGYDTRSSHQLFLHSLVAGLVASGVSVFNVGVCSTPALSFLIRHHRAGFGIMISASHNLYQDNGIKVFNSHGEKISLDIELGISDLFHKNQIDYSLNDIGQYEDQSQDGLLPYFSMLKKEFSHLSLEGIKIAIDCANGALSSWASTFLTHLGARALPIAHHPNGININAECGSTHPETLKQFMIQTKASIGFTFDGDGDRVIAINERGEILDGDQIMATLISQQLESRPPQPLSCQAVVTVMTNLGLLHFLESKSVFIHKTNVGDRFVADKIVETKAQIGGEPSGHIIWPSYSLVGDGFFIALKLLEVYQENKSLPLLFQPVKQKLDNIHIKNKNILTLPEWHSFMSSLTKQYAFAYILVRLSGTEPVVRVFVQSSDEEIVDKIIFLCRQKIFTLDHEKYFIS